MATYYSACRQFGTNIGNCPAREMGEKCHNCRNLLWVLRQKITENSSDESTNQEQSENKDK